MEGFINYEILLKKAYNEWKERAQNEYNTKIPKHF
jgi:hypothetical protein